MLILGKAKIRGGGTAHSSLGPDAAPGMPDFDKLLEEAV